VRALTVIAAALLSSAAANLAQGYQPVVNYQLHCMGCHLADGSGQPGRVPSIRRSLVLFSALPDGREYVVRVPGVAQSPLSSEDTAALLNWMARNLSDVKITARFADYSAAEIQGLRDRPLVTVSAIRARLLRTAAAKPNSP
jgi:mono/diheme cytochrome c family protein